MSAKESMSKLGRRAVLHDSNGSQNNECEFPVDESLNELNIAKNHVSRKIRRNCGTKDWNGSTLGKNFRCVKQSINRSTQPLNDSPNFKIDLFNELSSLESQKMIKRKKSHCTSKEEQNEKRVGKRSMKWN